MFYTYFWLREDGTPYYVGKGVRNRAFRKGCPPTYRIVIQEHPNEYEAFIVEKFFIDYYGRKDKGTGILRNRTDGGEGTLGKNESAVKSISSALLGNTHGLGHKHTDSSRKIMSIRAMGNSKGKANKGRPRPDMKGNSFAKGITYKRKPFSEEHRRKLSESHKKDNHSSKERLGEKGEINVNTY